MTFIIRIYDKNHNKVKYFFLRDSLTLTLSSRSEVVHSDNHKLFLLLFFGLAVKLLLLLFFSNIETQQSSFI